MEIKKCILLYFFTTLTLYSQQNFFNVPSTEITPKNKIFFQQQINFAIQNTTGSTTFCYGLIRNFEIGVNILGLVYDNKKHFFIKNKTKETPIFPSIGFNFQKKIDISKSYSLGIGYQNLVSMTPQIEHYMYINNKIELKKLLLILGIYSGNSKYFGLETMGLEPIKYLGFQGGVEYDIWLNKLFLQADWMSGKTPSSNFIVGVVYKIQKSIFISLGFQIPNYSKTSQNGIVFEFTYSPK